MAKRPGVMLYFDFAEPFGQLSDEDRGKLLSAILAYGQYGTLPNFDGVLALTWGFVRPKLDLDETKYQSTVMRRTYASYCASVKRTGRTPLDYDTWLSMQCGNHVGSDGSGSNPTAKPTGSISTDISLSGTALLSEEQSLKEAVDRMMDDNLL